MEIKNINVLLADSLESDMNSKIEMVLTLTYYYVFFNSKLGGRRHSNTSFFEIFENILNCLELLFRHSLMQSYILVLKLIVHLKKIYIMRNSQEEQQILT